MRYGSICSGIGCASVALSELGWRPMFFSEVEDFPSAVLTTRFPDIPNLGDFTKIERGDINGTLDLIIGGTPCQSFSVAGQRSGLDDPRGNLALEYCRLLARLRPRWFIWENVPGVLSSWTGDAPNEVQEVEEWEAVEESDLAQILQGFIEVGYGIAWRTLDAQYFGVPQRRRRVFVVGYLGDWRPAAAVLFERESMCGDPSASTEEGTTVAGLTATGVGVGGADDNQGRGGHLVASLMSHHGRNNPAEDTLIPCLNAGGKAAGSATQQDAENGALIVEGDSAASTPDLPRLRAGCGRGGETAVVVANTLSASTGHHGHSSPRGDGNDNLVVAIHENQRGECTISDTAGSLKTGGGKPGQGYPGIAFHGRQDPDVSGDVTHPLDTDDHSQAVAFQQHGSDVGEAGALRSGHGDVQSGVPFMESEMRVRRLTPRECERLQGLPDDWTAITYRGKPAADGPRYRAIGNGMAVPVVTWIGEGIQIVDALLEKLNEI